MRLVDALRRLLEQGSAYADLLRPGAGEARVCLALDDGERATLVLWPRPSVDEGCDEPDVTISMDVATWSRVLAGEADAFALAARGSTGDRRPVEIAVHDPAREAALWDVVRALLMVFFLPGAVKVRRLEADRAGEAHGGRPIPLAYWDGMRSAWYFLPPGTIVNEAGERDPWPQMFVVVSGTGTARVGDAEVPVRPRDVVYVPRGVVHQVRADEPMEVVWLAWDAG